MNESSSGRRSVRLFAILAVVLMTAVCVAVIVDEGDTDGDTFTVGNYRYEKVTINTARLLGFAKGHENDTRIEIANSVQRVEWTFTICEVATGAFKNCPNVTEIFFDAQRNDFKSGTDVFESAGMAGDGISVTMAEEFIEDIPANLFGTTNGKPPKIVSVDIADCVERIGDNAFKGCTYLGTVTGCHNVNSIGDSAFEGCRSLTGHLTIPDKVTKIGSCAFKGCESLTGLTLDDNLETIGAGAFMGCSSISGSVVVPNAVVDIPDSLFNGCRLVERFDIGRDVTSIGYAAFKNCAGITRCVLYDKLEGIGASAFQGCTNLRSLTIEAQDLFVEKEAFADCSRLETIELYGDIRTHPIPYTTGDDNTFSGAGVDGNGITVTIGGKATEVYHNLFYESNEKFVTPKIASVTIGGNVSKIGDEAFSKCTSLRSVTFGEGVRTIGKSAFMDCTVLPSITIAGTVETIGDGAFMGCSGLEKVTICDGVKTIGACAFKDCVGIYVFSFDADGCSVSDDSFANICATTRGDFVLGPHMTKIPDHLFSKDDSVGKLVIGDGISAIGDGRFQGFTHLDTLVIGKGVKTIGNHAFQGCTGFMRLEIPDGVETIGRNAFSGCSGLVEIIIGKGVSLIQSGAFDGCGSVFSLEFDAEECIVECRFTQFGTDDLKVVFGDRVRTVSAHMFDDNTKISEVVFGGNVTSIGDYAFHGCTNLSGGLTVPSGMTRIGNYAFQGCGKFTELSIGGDGITIGDNAFDACGGLSAVRINGSVASIGNHAFHKCAKLASVDIPDGAKHIGDYAFAYCKNLMALDLGTETETIGNNAFDGCAMMVTELDLPDLRTIGNCAFMGCARVMKVTFGDALAEISDSAFRGCTGIQSITIPGSVTAIGDRAFMGCSNISGVLIEDGDGIAIGREAFSGCFQYYDEYNYVNVTGNVTSFGDLAFGDCPGISIFAFGAFGEDIAVGEHVFSYLSQTDDIVDYAFSNNDGSKFAFTEERVRAQSFNEHAYTVTEDGTAVSRLLITFDARGGECEAKYTVTDEDGKIPRLPVPVKEGFVFEGWYDENGAKVTYDTQFSRNSTLTAKWTRESADGSHDAALIAGIAMIAILVALLAALVARYRF